MLLNYQRVSDGKSMVVDVVSGDMIYIHGGCSMNVLADWRLNARFNKTIYCIIINIYI